MKRFYEERKLDKKWIEDYCFNNHRGCKRYEAEEKGEFHPDNMLPNGEIDKSLKWKGICIWLYFIFMIHLFLIKKGGGEKKW